jgi:hypothetical protein
MSQSPFTVKWPVSIKNTALGSRLRRVGASRALAFSVAGQAWSALAGPFTMVAIANWLSPVEQGFYYTFNSALGLQILFELGLATVLVQSASHEWAHLGFDAEGKVVGMLKHRSRLASLMRFAIKWYVLSGISVVLGLGLGGYVIFSKTAAHDFSWEIPWFLLSALTGMTLMTTPLVAIVEGCNQVASVYLFRLLQGVSTSLVVVAAIAAGAGLYAPALGSLVRLVSVIVFLSLKQRRLLDSLFKSKIEEAISWRREIWPFQWRIGVSWMSGYIIFSLITPLVFFHHGPLIAGQMGMTLALVTAIDTIAYPWVNTRMPELGMLIAKRKYAELDDLFRRLALAALAVASLGGLGLWTLILLAQLENINLAHRMLPLLPASFVILHRVLNVGVGLAALYMRAHKEEPMMVPSLVAALLTLVAFAITMEYGTLGATAGLLAVLLLWVIPATWITYKRFLRRRGGDGWSRE